MEANKANTALEERLKESQDHIYDLELRLDDSKADLAAANKSIELLKKKLNSTVNGTYSG